MANVNQVQMVKFLEKFLILIKYMNILKIWEIIIMIYFDLQDFLKSMIETCHVNKYFCRNHSKRQTNQGYTNMLQRNKLIQIKLEILL